MGGGRFGGLFFRLLLVGVALLVVVGVLVPVVGVGADSGGERGGVTAQGSGFSDIGRAGVHQQAVEALAAEGVFDGTGCGEGLFCPGEPIHRWVMAVWLVRILDGTDPAGRPSRFDDVEGARWWSPYVERLAELGVTSGCSAEPLLFCPDSAVTRAQMASFLVRAFGLPPGPSAGFTDVEATNVHYGNINALADLGVTAGCADSRFCPQRDTTRAQMASFLFRALNLATTPPAAYKAVAAGSWHSCAVATDDTITCWGSNRFGQADAPAGTYKAVAADTWHSCAVATDDTITCWGHNSDGQADPPSGTYKAVAAGSWHSCAVATDDTITCWGSNRFGQADAPAGTYKAVAAGSSHSCAVATDDTITCWGHNFDGQADPPAGTYKAVAAGTHLSCAVATDDTITCWGHNYLGEADAPAGSYKAVAVGWLHSCAVATDGTITCWGENFDGQADPPAGTYKAVAAGTAHSCAVATDDTITCWGHNEQADPPAGTYRAVTAGEAHSCAVATDDTITCWGSNRSTGRRTHRRARTRLWPPAGTIVAR